MELFYWPRTHAFTALWMLEEVEEPYELVHVDLRASNHPTPEYMRVNPMGKLPGFRDGEVAMGETAAILLYLADKFPGKGFAPALDDTRRGRFLQWLMFPVTTIEPAMREKQRGEKPRSQQSGWGDYDRAMRVLESAMTPGRWLLGATFTAADLYVASVLRFGMQFGLIEQRVAFVEFAARAQDRSACQRAEAIEGRALEMLLPPR